MLVSPAVSVLALAAFVAGAAAHPGHGVPLKKGMMQGLARAYLQEQWSGDTASGLVLDLYGSLGLGWSDRLVGSDPLGSGGIPSQYLNNNLYLESPIDFGSSASLQKRNLRLDSRDFGYIPIWQPNQAGIRLQNRFRPDLWGTVAIQYDGTFHQFADQIQAGQFALSEAHASWRPRRASLARAGLLQNVSLYVPEFDVAPLENNSLAGLSFSHALRLPGGWTLKPEITAGQNFAGYTVLHDTASALLLNEGYYQTRRIRTLGYANLRAQGPAADILLASGFQFMPEDTSIQLDRLGEYNTQVLAAERGWFAGLGGEIRPGPLRMGALYVLGRGGIDMGWGRPKPVEYNRPGSIDNRYFSSQDSRLDNLLLWGGAAWKAFECGGGFWFTRDTPDPNPRTLRDPNSIADTNQVLLNAGIRTGDSIRVEAEEFKAIRWTLAPSLRFLGAYRAGIRYDQIHFLDPDARSNTLEYRRDVTLNPQYYPGYVYPLYGPSRWELEPVNSRVFSPFLSADLGNVFQVEIWYALAWYDQEVRRQGVVADFHQNFNIRMTFHHRFHRDAVPPRPRHDPLDVPE